MNGVRAIASHCLECPGALNIEPKNNRDSEDTDNSEDSQAYQIGKAKKASNGHNNSTRAVVTVGDDFSQRVSCTYFRASDGACRKFPDSLPCTHYRVGSELEKI
jgi:hypothetical protein